MVDKRREVEELRQEIGKLDVTLRTTLERRARLSRKIGELGKTAGIALPSGAEMDRWMEGATGDMPAAAMREIFREILATCLSLERPVVVAFSGAEGCFVHAAARSRFGVLAEYTSCETIAATLEEVARDRAGYAVVPFETRTDGLSQATIMALASSDLKIVLSFETVENLQLASKADSMAEIDKVYAMAKDRAHSARYLAKALSSAQLLDVATPMLACQLAAADPRAAALAHESIAVEQGLHVLDRNVRDDGEERVRYAVIGTRPSTRSGNDLTAIVFAVNDSPGALHDVLRQFAERGINLTKIQSRPTQGATWQYLFFIEVQGHATDRPIVGALEELRRHARYFKVLGSYSV
ncbi:MAG: ACT domain-containing protein [Polyangiaceae bacterium]|nr:ACT domain-containing protein [Polyangiaceae bacterium]